MKVVLKLDKRFFPNKSTEKKEQESPVERMLRSSRTGTSATCAVYLSAKPVEILIRRSQTADSPDEILTSKQEISNRKITVLSHAGAIIMNEMTKPANGIKEIINSVYDSGAYVQPFNITKPGQKTFSENETPKGLLPP
jgi:hypothetical protein